MTFLRTTLAALAASGLALAIAGSAHSGGTPDGILVGDFNGDTTTDILLTTDTPGDPNGLAFWFMQDDGVIDLTNSGTIPRSADYTAAATGDFGDCQGGQDDVTDLVLVKNDQTDYQIWCLTGELQDNEVPDDGEQDGMVTADRVLTISFDIDDSGTNVPHNVLAVADFDSDGKAREVLVQPVGETNASIHSHAADGSFMKATNIGELDGDVIIGDFDARFGFDIMLVNASRNIFLITNLRDVINDSVAPVYVYLGDLPAGQTAIAARDMNGDRRSDLLLQEADGNLLAWIFSASGEGNGFAVEPGNIGNPQFETLDLDLLAAGLGDFGGPSGNDIVLQEGAGATRTVAVWTLNVTTLEQEFDVTAGEKVSETYVVRSYQSVEQ